MVGVDIFWSYRHKFQMSQVETTTTLKEKHLYNKQHNYCISLQAMMQAYPFGYRK